MSMFDYGFPGFGADCYGGYEPQGLDWGHGGYDPDCYGGTEYFGGFQGYQGGDDSFGFAPVSSSYYGGNSSYTDIDIDNSRTIIQKERGNNMLSWLLPIGTGLLGYFAGKNNWFGSSEPQQPQVVYRDRPVYLQPPQQQVAQAPPPGDYVSREELNAKLDNFFRINQRK